MNGQRSTDKSRSGQTTSGERVVNGMSESLTRCVPKWVCVPRSSPTHEQGSTATFSQGIHPVSPHTPNTHFSNLYALPLTHSLTHSRYHEHPLTHSRYHEHPPTHPPTHSLTTRLPTNPHPVDHVRPSGHTGRLSRTDEQTNRRTQTNRQTNRPTDHRLFSPTHSLPPSLTHSLSTHSHERTNERTDERTNEQTNERTNERSSADPRPTEPWPPSLVQKSVVVQVV